MKTTNFEAETWFQLQRPETPSRVLEPLGTKINFAACHRSDAMVAKKVEYRSGSQIWRYGRFASDGLCRLSGVAAGLPDTSAPPQMASGGHDGLQTPTSPSLEAIRGHAQGSWTRQVPKRPLESRKASKASVHPGRSLEAIRGRAGLQDTTWVAQGFHVPPGTQTSSKRPPDLQTPPSPPYCTHMTSGGLSED